VRHRLIVALACWTAAAGAAAAQVSGSLSALQVKQAIEARKAVYVLTARSLAPLEAMSQGKLAFNASDALKRARRPEWLAEMGQRGWENSSGAQKASLSETTPVAAAALERRKRGGCTESQPFHPLFESRSF
jgi:hypothetical protein